MRDDAIQFASLPSSLEVSTGPRSFSKLKNTFCSCKVQYQHCLGNRSLVNFVPCRGVTGQLY